MGEGVGIIVTGVGMYLIGFLQCYLAFKSKYLK